MIEIMIVLVLVVYLYDFWYIFFGKKFVGILIIFFGGYYWDNLKVGQKFEKEQFKNSRGCKNGFGFDNFFKQVISLCV